MNKVNFDGLKKIKAPDAWLEKAAAVPGTVSKRRAAFPVYRFAAAAGVVLVSVIGLIVYGFYGKNGAPLAVRSGSTEVSATFAVAETAGNNSDLSPTLSDPAVLPTGPEHPTDGEGEKAADAAVPTEGVTVPHSTVPSATAAPTQRTTQHVPAPTGTPAPTVSPTKPPAPTSPPATQPPTESYRPPGDCEIYGTFSLGTAGGSGNYAVEETTIFCRLYDSAGNLVGDSGMYSPQREAEILSRNSDGSVFAYYNPAEKGLYLTEDSYVYVFYDIHGSELYRDVKLVF